MKKLGFILAYAPEQTLKGQGIGRLIGFMLSGILNDPDVEIVIALPAWYKHTLLDFFQDADIDPNRVELLTTPGIPFFLKIKNAFKKYYDYKEKIKFSFLRKLKNEFKINLIKYTLKWLSISSPILFILVGIAGFAITIFLLPLILLSSILVFLNKFGSKIINKIKKFIPSYIIDYLVNPIKGMRGNLHAHSIFSEFRSIEINKLIKSINQRKDISIWFVPALFWPEIKGIKAKKIVAAPDIVFIDFPTLFDDKLTVMTYERVMQSLHVSNHLICYSDYVRKNHIVEPFNIAPSKVSVIKHGAVDLYPYLKSDSTEVGALRTSALNILTDFQSHFLKNNPYLHEFDFTQIRFIFYSSQVRPHKNILSLVKATEILLRKRFMNVKLILTGCIAHSASLKEYCISKRLQYDVLFISDVSSKVLAALNHLAICAVNPTLFEGGFPFTFTEAYSVGTPSVMSDIPVTRAEIDDSDLASHMLFDPYNMNDMVNRIDWAINHRDRLYQMQHQLYEKMQERSWEKVSKEYIELFKKHAV